jgi:hypothetical protein
MRFSGFSNAFRGAGGEYEVNRLVGGLGAVAYIIGAHIFVGWDVIAKGRPFDITAYCLAFPGGLGVAVGSIAGAVAWKDKGVASAKIINETGAVPAPPPDGPKVPTDEVKP